MDIGTLLHPVTTRLGIGTLDNEFIQHRLQYSGHRERLLVQVDLVPASWAILEGFGLGGPGMVEAFATEVMAAGELDGLIERRVAD